LLYSKYSTYVLYLPVCLPVCLSVCPSVCLSVCLSACLPAGLPACKKISSKIAKIKKLVTRTPVSTKRTNRVASKNHTSGIDKKIFLSDLISRGLMGKHTEKSDQNSKKKFSVLAGLKWRVAMASCHGAFSWRILLHHVENPPSKLAVWPRGGGGRTL
jgi:hypothetical protein